MDTIDIHFGDYQENRCSNESSTKDVLISNLILTPLTCSSLVAEIIKGLLYQKCQIPYPYTWMQRMIRRKRESEESTNPNISIYNHFLGVSRIYDKMESAMKGIAEEFEKDKDHIQEVVIVFGTTPLSPKEVYSINVSRIAKGHIERNHAVQMSKLQQKILRSIFLSQSWIDSIDTSMPCTNTYVFLKRSPGFSDRNRRVEDFFLPTQPLTFAPNLKYVQINLYPEDADSNCCENLLVYGDNKQKKDIVDKGYKEEEMIWYQFRDTFKGFKDCYVGKKSVSELW